MSIINNSLRQIQTIERFIRNHKHKYQKPVFYNNQYIRFKDIRSFSVSYRKENDTNNKRRESIIGAIINNIVPIDYFTYSYRWLNLKIQLDKYIQTIYGRKPASISCIHKAGRVNHYDFKLLDGEKQEFNIEFKFNTISIEKAPQFVSPVNITEYLETSYIEFYYRHYLENLLVSYGFTLPALETYIEEIQTPTPPCMLEAQSKYYRGCKNSSRYSSDTGDIEFYKKSKEIAKASIVDFISNNGLKLDILSDYLVKSQGEKHYMLYKSGKLYYQKVDSREYRLVSYIREPRKQRYIATTESGKKIKILLRWKNGNGIAFPAFQIS
jgi:hypothetical protein